MLNLPYPEAGLDPEKTTRIELDASDFASASTLVDESLSLGRPSAALRLVIDKLHREAVAESRTLGRTTGPGLLPHPIRIDDAFFENQSYTEWAPDSGPKMSMQFIGEDETVIVFVISTENLLPRRSNPTPPIQGR